MNKTVYKVLTWAVLPAIIILLTVLLFGSIREPMMFNDERAKREAVAIQRLKDIRDLQDAFKSVYARYSPTSDSLIWFYNNGQMQILKNIGSRDDSVAVAHTDMVIKKKCRGLKGEKLAAKLNELYEQGDSLLVFNISTKINVKDTLFNHRKDFVVDSLKYIPFSGGQEVIVQTTIMTVSGVKVPLFEACMPFKALLKGMDNQLRINLDADQEKKGYYKGLQVGSVTTPNNNAGNWE